MRAAAIACQVVQSEPGWNLWGLRISRGHVRACLQICCALLLKGGELSKCVCNGVIPPEERYFNEMWCLLDSVLLQSVPSPSCNWCRSACCVLPLQVGDSSPNQQQVQPAEGTQLYQSSVAAPDAPWCQCQVSSMGFLQMLT